MRAAPLVFVVIAGCSAITLRQAQDEYNAGIAVIDTPSALPEAHFRKALELLDEGALKGEGEPHERVAALVIDGYSSYGLYRLTGDDASYRRAQAAWERRAESLAQVPESKRGVVRREAGLLAMLSPLLRAEHAMREYEKAERVEDLVKRRSAHAKVFGSYESILKQCLEVRDEVGVETTTAPYLAIVTLDLCEGAAMAYSKSVNPAETADAARDIGPVAAAAIQMLTWLKGSRRADADAIDRRTTTLKVRLKQIWPGVDTLGWPK